MGECFMKSAAICPFCRASAFLARTGGKGSRYCLLWIYYESSGPVRQSGEGLLLGLLAFVAFKRPLSKRRIFLPSVLVLLLLPTLKMLCSELQVLAVLSSSS